MFALVLHVLFSNPAFILHVMWFKLFIIIFRRWRSCLQTAPLFAIVNCQCFSLHAANLAARSTWDRRLRVFLISWGCKGHSNLHTCESWI